MPSTMSRAWPLLQRLLHPKLERVWNLIWKQRPLRQKLAIGVWISVVPIAGTTTVVSFKHMEGITRAQTHEEMLWAAQSLGEGFDYMLESELQSLKFISELDHTRSLDSARTNEALERLQKRFPQYSFWLTKKNGQVVAQTKQQVEGSSANDSTIDPIEMRALAGIADNGFTHVASPLRSCLITSVPVYASAQDPSNTGSRRKPIAALSSCISMSDIARAPVIHNARPKIPDTYKTSFKYDKYLDFEDPMPRGIAMFFATKVGRVILLEQEGYPTDKVENLINPDYVAKSPWKNLLNLALDAKKTTETKEIKLNGRDYFIAVKATRPNYRGVAMIDSDTAFEDINNLFRWILLGEIAAISFGSFVVYRICENLSQPIDQVGAVLARISQGDFGQTLPKGSDDIGQLFDYVNQASAKLQNYLNESKDHAVTSAQLEQARLIQKDFLVQRLPSDEQVDLAADFEPAYEIGADWYDALKIGGITIVVVADVCDKGIPSALYMSVFRSLLRLNLQEEFRSDTAQLHPDQALCRAIAITNRYMAEAHGDGAMFATAFVGAYLPERQLLTYVVAGHESPLVFHQGQVTPLSLGGPVLGVFAEAKFQVGQISFQAGDALLAFSDGLPDARNAGGEDFGKERTLALFEHLAAKTTTAAELLDAVKSAVVAHMGSADQFDDLTLLTMRAKVGA